jgi:CBS domain-containing membrane protein
VSKFFKHLFFADSARVSTREKLLSGVAALFGVFVLSAVSYHFVGSQGLPYMVASMGAASVLLFAVPHSPLSQPWPLVGGHLVCALVGVLCRISIDYVPLAAALAVALAIVSMFALRCIHPPGGAAALGAVVGGPDIHALGFVYVLVPVGLNAILLLLAAIGVNRLVPNRQYPMPVREKVLLSSMAAQWALGAPRFRNDDLQHALREMDSYIDVSESDLARIYALAAMHANKRRIGEVSCRDVMSANPISLHFDTELEAAWRTLHQSNIKGAPVVDAFGRLLGMVTVNDLMRHATDYEQSGSLGERLRAFLQRTPGHVATKAEVVGQIMSRPAISCRDHQHIVDVIPAFTEKGIHHLPVLDESGKVVGMLTRSDVMRAMLVTRGTLH